MNSEFETRNPDPQPFPAAAYDDWLTSTPEDKSPRCHDCSEWLMDCRCPHPDDLCPDCQRLFSKCSCSGGAGPEDYYDPDPDCYVPEWFDGR